MFFSFNQLSYLILSQLMKGTLMFLFFP
jgi:hypothetical protein